MFRTVGIQPIVLALARDYTIDSLQKFATDCVFFFFASFATVVEMIGHLHTQITILCQEKVAAIIDIDARLSMCADDVFMIDTKPHGHGDVHQLIHSSGIGKAWREQGIELIHLHVPAVKMHLTVCVSRPNCA